MTHKPYPVAEQYSNWKYAYTAINKIKSEDLGYSQNLKAAFEAEDRGCRGVVHRVVFRDILNSFNHKSRWRLVCIEIEALIKQFMTPNKPSEVNYNAFLHMIFCRCTNNDCHRKFMHDIKWNLVLPARQSNPNLNAHVERVLDEINRRLKSFNLDIRALFHLDSSLTNNDGYCHAAHLYESLRRAGVLVQKSDYDYIVNRYEVGGAFIHEASFFHDLEKSYRRLNECGKTYATPGEFRNKPVIDVTNKNIRMPLGPGNIFDHDYIMNDWYRGRFTRINTGPKDDVFTIVSRIQKHIFEHQRANYHLFFKDFEKRSHIPKTGKIPRDLFFNALDNMGVSVTRPGIHILNIRRDELEDLADAYKVRHQPELVNWRKFFEDLLYVFGAKPTTDHVPRYENFNPSLNVKYLENRNPQVCYITKEECKRASQIMKDMMKHNKTFKMNFAQFFEKFDKDHRRRISPSQFLRGMHCAGFKLNFKDGILLSKFFTDMDGFNYLKFAPIFGDKTLLLWDELIEHIHVEDKKPPDVIIEAPVPNEKLTFPDVLNKVKITAYMRRLKLTYFWKEHDKNKIGYWNREQFKYAMKSVYDWPLSHKEYEVLMDGLADPFDKNIIMYPLLLRLIDETEALPNLEKTPLVQPLPVVHNRYHRRMLSSDEMDALQRAWIKITRYEKWGWKQWEIIEVSRYYDDKTVIPREHISRLKYEQGLTTMGIHHLLTPTEIDVLFDAYAIDVVREVRFNLKYFFRDAEQMYIKHRNKSSRVIVAQDNPDKRIDEDVPNTEYIYRHILK